jgi:hypothetical protein
MKKVTKLFGALLALVMVFTSVFALNANSVVAKAEDAVLYDSREEYKDFKYIIVNGDATVVGYADGTKTSLVIPAFMYDEEGKK